MPPTVIGSKCNYQNYTYLTIYSEAKYAESKTKYFRFIG